MITEDLAIVGPDDVKILAEYRASQRRVLDEQMPALELVKVAPTTSVTELAEIIRSDPMAMAVRWLNLEWQVREQHRRLERVEARLASLHGSIR